MKILQICNEIPNFGDRLARIITERLFGHSVIEVFNAIPSDFSNTRVLAGLGSFLGYYLDWPLEVWGTGFEPGYLPRETLRTLARPPNWRIHAVRGHVTRVAFGLHDDIPVGDPGYLVPNFYTPHATYPAKVRYFTHCDHSDEKINVDADEVISTTEDVFSIIDRIVSSEFVFTESLHVAIVAHAYNIPWAWALRKHYRGMTKWYDWFSSIDVNGTCFRPQDLLTARCWYKGAKSDMKRINTDRLLAAFPHDIGISAEQIL